MLRATVLIAVLAAVLALAGCGGAAGLGGDVEQRLLPAGDRKEAPAITVPALFGKGTQTLSEREGRPVLINFWASWCEPCTREMPHFVEFSRAHPEIDVLGIAVNDRPADSRRFAQRIGVSFDLGVDRDGDVASDYDVPGLPITVVIDPQGRIASNFVGEISARQLESYAEQLGG